jgi:hypothetical protein
MKFGTADFALGNNFDFGDTRGVEREYTLDTFAIRDFTNRESRVDAAATFCDHDASKNLNALFSTFNPAAMDFDGIANIE